MEPFTDRLRCASRWRLVGCPPFEAGYPQGCPHDVHSEKILAARRVVGVAWSARRPGAARRRVCCRLGAAQSSARRVPLVPRSVTDASSELLHVVVGLPTFGQLVADLL